jgi:hypothetical protein
MRYDVELIVNSQKYATDYTLNIKVLSAAAIGDTTIVVGINYGNESLVEVGSRLLIVTTGQLVTLVARENLVDDEWALTIDQPLTGSLAPLATIRVLSLFTTRHVLELYDNETISQNWRFQDLTSFTALGSFSRQFRIPATATNCDACGILHDVNWADSVDYFQTKMTAELRVQTLPIARGYIRVMKAITQADKLADFEITFYSETPDLFTSITGKKLRDLDGLRELNAVLDYDEVINATGYPYLYSLTDYGQQWSEAGEQGTRSIYATRPFSAPRAADLTPSLSWRWIFQQIIKEAGFTYTGVELDNILYRYFAPWINSKQLNYLEKPEQTFFKFYLSTPLTINSGLNVFPSVIEVFDNGSNVSAGLFTAPYSGMFKFRYWISTDLPFGPGGTPLNVAPLQVVFQNLTSGDSQMINEIPLVSGFNNFDSTNTAPEFFLKDGDTFQIAFSGLIGLVLETGEPYTSGSGLELIDVNIVDGATLDWTANAPDMLQTDFMRDVFNMHCCVVVPDRLLPNVMQIAPIKDYLGTGSSRDWSDKLDISKDIVIGNTADFQTKNMTFTYSAGEDVGSKIYTGLNRIYGDFKVSNYTVSENDVPTDFAKDGELKVQLTTQSTPSNYINGTGIPIPKFVDQDGNFVAPKMRCLFQGGDVEMTLMNFDTFIPDTAYTVPLLSHFRLIIPQLNTDDLNWAPESTLYISGIAPIDNLFNLYWRDYLNELYSPQARVLEAHFALDLADVQSFTFADRIWCKGAWWRILDINDYKIGTSDTVAVKLLKIVEAAPMSSATPDEVNAGGEVTFVDGAGNPITPTQATCERYGFTWDPITQTCFANTTQPQNISNQVPTKLGRSTNEVSSAPNSLIIANNLDNDSSNSFTITVGNSIKMEANNTQSIAVGEKLTKLESGGVAMFGKNVQTNIPGLHYGGGYRLNDPSNGILGFAQAGQIILHNYVFVTLGGIAQELYLDGESGRHITLEDNTLWSCLLNLTITDSSLTGYHVGQYSFGIYKVGGSAGVGAITIVAEDSALGTNVFTIAVDVVTDSNQHRITVTPTGGTYPDQFYFVASITYQQVRTS